MVGNNFKFQIHKMSEAKMWILLLIPAVVFASQDTQPNSSLPDQERTGKSEKFLGELYPTVYRPTSSFGVANIVCNTIRVRDIEKPCKLHLVIHEKYMLRV